MYFNMFPVMLYSLDNGRTAQAVQDIARRITMSSELKENSAVYDLYDVRDGETPEIVADKFYKNPQYHWVVLLYNDIIDPRYEWPLGQSDLIAYCKSKYGENNLYATHHYVNAKGFQVNSTAFGATPVSNFQHEEQLNENKRRIKILNPLVVSEIVSSFEGLVNQ